MAVAPSFERLMTYGSPFTENKREYIYVIKMCKKCTNYGENCLKCQQMNGQLKKVRWYTEDQKENLFNTKPANSFVRTRTEKQVFGFERTSSITIFKGDIEAIETYCHSLPVHTARYNTIFGWFIGDWCEPIEINPPAEVAPVVLEWDKIGNAAGALKLSDEEIRAVVNELTNDNNSSNSIFIGNTGDKIEVTLTCKKVDEKDTAYGHCYLHSFIDNDGNNYEWLTASRKMELEKVYHVTAKIKDHKIIKNVKTTIINYVREKK